MKEKGTFDIGQCQKKLKQMKQHKLEALVKEKIDKENEIVELKKKLQSLFNKIDYRKRKVGKQMAGFQFHHFTQHQ